MVREQEKSFGILEEEAILGRKGFREGSIGKVGGLQDQMDGHSELVFPFLKCPRTSSN